MIKNVTEISGTSVVLGDHVDSEQLHPAVYFSLDEARVKAGLFKGMRDRCNSPIPHDAVIVAGRNFGCGSSREVVVRSLALNGIQAVVADSFARIFFRNCLNLGLPAIECPGLRDATKEGDSIRIALTNGVIENASTGMRHEFDPPGNVYLSLLKQGWQENISERSQPRCIASVMHDDTKRHKD